MGKRSRNKKLRRQDRPKGVGRYGPKVAAASPPIQDRLDEIVDAMLRGVRRRGSA